MMVALKSLPLRFRVVAWPLCSLGVWVLSVLVVLGVSGKEKEGKEGRQSERAHTVKSSE